MKSYTIRLTKTQPFLKNFFAFPANHTQLQVSWFLNFKFARKRKSHRCFYSWSTKSLLLSAMRERSNSFRVVKRWRGNTFETVTFFVDHFMFLRWKFLQKFASLFSLPTRRKIGFLLYIHIPFVFLLLKCTIPLAELKIFNQRIIFPLVLLRKK